MWFTIVIILSNWTLLHGIRSASPMIVRRNGIFSNSCGREVWFRTAQTVAKGGIANSKDSVKHQTSLWKAKKPSQKVDLFNGRRDRQHPLFVWIEWRRQKEVSNKFEVHFVKQRNPIYEQRSLICIYRQEKGGSVNSFITLLYQLAEHCSYCDLHNKMIQDRIVVGLRDSNLWERLQADPELTLDKVITMIRQT